MKDGVPPAAKHNYADERDAPTLAAGGGGGHRAHKFKSGTQPSTADGTQELLLRAETKKKASGGGRRGEHGAGATTQKPARGARRTPQGGGSGLCSAPRRHTNAAHRRAQGLRRHCEGREIHGIVIDTTKLSAGERVHQPKRGTLDGGGIEHKQPRDPQDVAETSASSSPPQASQTNIERSKSNATMRSSTTCEWARRAPSTA